MYSTPFLLRVTKTISVAGIALMALLVVIGNTTDYYSNYFFVAHVLEMDTIFPGSHLQYRSIHSPFIFLILLEAAMAFCCLKGAILLGKNLKKEAAVFQAKKNWAIAGIIIGILIWFLGFEVIGGEWFAMWQSAVWNGLAAAERMLSFLLLTLILLHLKEE